MSKIVNAHVHFGVAWGPSCHLDVRYTPDALLRDMDRDCVDMSIILPMIFNYDIEWHCRCAREHSDRLIAYVMFNPWRHKNIKDEIRLWKDWGARGIKLRAPSEGFNINSFELLHECFSTCEDEELMLMVHTGDDVSSTPLQCEEILKYYPNLKLTISHSGFRNLADEAIRVAQRNKNIILDQTAATSQQLRDALSTIETERIIWGSDSPYMDERVELEKIRVGVEDNEKRNKILGENILNILGIK
ncbi:MAG: amidohydrolase family protein [Christensenellales bacterium]|jgi:predicted TIM-barrel fold metal-dependent hydrolase